MRRLAGLAAAVISTAAFAWSLPAAAGVILFTDQSAWQAAAGGGPFVTDTFDGPAQNFLPDSTGNVPNGSAITVDINGHVGDGTPQGPTGNGLFQIEVDGGGGDVADVDFNFPEPIVAFGLTDVDNVANEGVRAAFAGFTSETFATVLGSDEGPFLGFVSDTPFSTVNFLLSGNEQGADQWDFDDLLYVTAAPTAVDTPTPLALLGLGLVATAALARRGKHTA